MPELEQHSKEELANMIRASSVLAVLGANYRPVPAKQIAERARMTVDDTVVALEDLNALGYLKHHTPGTVDFNGETLYRIHG